MLTRIKVQNCIDQILENGTFTTLSWVLTRVLMKTQRFHKLMKITKFKDNCFHRVVRCEFFLTNLLPHPSASVHNYKLRNQDGPSICFPVWSFIFMYFQLYFKVTQHVLFTVDKICEIWNITTSAGQISSLWSQRGIKLQNLQVY